LTSQVRFRQYCSSSNADTFPFALPPLTAALHMHARGLRQWHLRYTICLGTQWRLVGCQLVNGNIRLVCFSQCRGSGFMYQQVHE
jgi:hypothetical protein